VETRIESKNSRWSRGKEDAYFRILIRRREGKVITDGSSSAIGLNLHRRREGKKSVNSLPRARRKKKREKRGEVNLHLPLCKWEGGREVNATLSSSRPI